MRMQTTWKKAWYIRISLAQLTTSLRQFCRPRKSRSNLTSTLVRPQFATILIFLFLVVLRYGQINSIPRFNNLSPSGSLPYPLSAMMRAGFFRGRPPSSTLYPFRLCSFQRMDPFFVAGVQVLSIAPPWQMVSVWPSKVPFYIQLDITPLEAQV